MGAVQLRMPQSSDTPDNVVSFGNYQLLFQQRKLLRSGSSVELGDRAFELLMALVESPGRTVSKDELILKVWSQSAVGENALQAQISALRRAFGADRGLIVTVSGRGYQFAGELSQGPQAARLDPVQQTLPVGAIRLIGRESDLERVAALVRAHRLVAIVGTGGVGKTELGSELARRIAAEFAGGVLRIDLAAIGSPQAARAALLAVIGDLDTTGPRTSSARTSTADAPARLLVLDGCERWIGLAAELTDATLRLNRATRVLATSREALRVEGESIFRLSPLGLPDHDLRDAGAMSKAPAVQMFLARLAASGGSAPPDAQAVKAASLICLALDGIPLAIEMAAVRAAGVGVDWVVAHLNQPLAWLTHGSRMAPERQRSLQATLDWSFDALSAPERWALKRVSGLGEPFSLDDTCRLLEADGIDAADALDRLSSLVGKSLVERLESSGTVSYKLFRLTRGCALAMPWPPA